LVSPKAIGCSWLYTLVKLFAAEHRIWHGS